MRRRDMVLEALVQSIGNWLGACDWRAMMAGGTSRNHPRISAPHGVVVGRALVLCRRRGPGTGGMARRRTSVMVMKMMTIQTVVVVAWTRW